MDQRKLSRGKKAPEHPKPWALDLAFKLGKTANVVSRKVRTAAITIEEVLSPLKTACAPDTGGKPPEKKSRVKVLPDTSGTALSPVQKEIRDLFDISGLTDAIREIEAISRRHACHPVIQRLLSKLKGLSPADQEMLSGKFLERLTANPYFSQAMLSLPRQAKMTEEDARKMSDAFIECFSQTLGDMGVPQEDQDELQKLSGAVMRPLDDLIQLYLKPKTFAQKMKRLWKLQRIFVKTIKLIHMTKKLGAAGEQPVNPASPIYDIPR